MKLSPRKRIQPVALYSIQAFWNWALGVESSLSHSSSFQNSHSFSSNLTFVSRTPRMKEAAHKFYSSLMDSRPTRAGRQTNLAMVSIILLQFANMARGLSPCACGTERAEKARSQPPRRKVSRRQEKSSMRVQNTTHERQEVTATCEKHGREVERLSKLPINAKRKQIMNRK